LLNLYDPWLYYITGLGCIIGSFLNVMGLRLLREESFIWKRSYCYSCNTMIEPYHNIPIVSWLVLRGRCATCKAPIHWQYPLVELVTGLGFAAIYTHWGVTLYALWMGLLFINCVVIAITDLREQYIFDINSLGLIPLGLVFNILNLQQSAMIPLGGGWALNQGLLSSVEGGLVIWLIFFCLNKISIKVFGQEGFGEGDTRLLIGIASFFGLYFVLKTLAISLIIQVFIGFPLMLYNWLAQKAYKTIGLLLGGFALALAPLGMQLFISSPGLLLCISLSLAILAMVLCFKAFVSAREQDLSLTVLPFGPAICLAALALTWATPAV
jgi:leader peptidase (prepilin peptidase) / N-methyltransferase